MSNDKKPQTGLTPHQLLERLRTSMPDAVAEAERRQASRTPEETREFLERMSGDRRKFVDRTLGLDKFDPSSAAD